LLKTRYFFLNLGILENVVPSIISNRKKVKSLLFSLRTRENATLCANAATKLYEKYEFRESKTFGAFIQSTSIKKKINLSSAGSKSVLTRISRKAK